MTDAASIAAKLTKAEADALFGRYSFAGPHEEDAGEARLYELGLWRWPRGKESIITPLGLAVRAILKEQNNAE